MDLGLRNKVAMVAAASKGIGYAAAEQLAAEGCKVSICARNKTDVDAAAAKLGNAKGYVVDITQRHQLEQWHADTGRDIGAPDILITNTGGPPAGYARDMTDEQWQSGVESTLMNVVRLVRLVTPAMQT